MMFGRAAAIAYKEILHLWRDPFGFRILLLQPLVQMAICGFALQALLPEVPVAVCDLDHTSVSRQWTREIETSTRLRVAAKPTARDALDPLLVKGTVRAAIVIPEGFARSIFAGKPAQLEFRVDASDSVLATQSALSGELLAMRTSLEWTARRLNTVLNLTGASPPADHPVQARILLLFNPDGRSANFILPGLAALLLQAANMALGALCIAREREQGTFETLITAGVRPATLVAGKLAANTAMSSLHSVFILALVVWLFRVPIHGSLATLAVAVALSGFVGIAAGLFVSTIVTTSSQAFFITNFFTFASGALSGLFYPVEAMPPPFREIAQLLPSTHAVTLFRAILVRGASLTDVLSPIVWLASIGIGVIAAALLQDSWRRLRRE